MNTNANIKDMKQHLQNLIAEGKTEQAIAQLLQLPPTDENLRHEIVMLSSRFSENERKRHTNTSPQDKLDVELNKINTAVLVIIDKLPYEIDRNSTAMPSHKWTKASAAIVIAAGLLVVIAGILGYPIRNLFGKEKEKPAVVQPVLDSLPSVGTPKVKTEVTPEIIPKPAEKKPSTEVPRNHFESRNESKQVNIPDNQGDIKIDQ